MVLLLTSNSVKVSDKDFSPSNTRFSYSSNIIFQNLGGAERRVGCSAPRSSTNRPISYVSRKIRGKG